MVAGGLMDLQPCSRSDSIYIQFQSLRSGLMTIFLAWFGLERVSKADAFVAGDIGS